VRGKAVEARLRSGATARVETTGYELEADSSAASRCLCAAATKEQAGACTQHQDVSLKVIRAAAEPAAKPAALNGGGSAPVRVELPVPVSDGGEGLFTSLAIGIDLDPTEKGGRSSAEGQCGWSIGRGARLVAALEGIRLEALKDPKAAGWQ
jgi:hypothetical protein